MRAEWRVKALFCVASLVATLFCSTNAAAQPVPLAFALSPTFGPGSCINGTANGYTGSDSLSFTAPATGYYSVANFSGGVYWAFVDPDSYDSDVRIIDQSIASNFSGSSTTIALFANQTRTFVLFFNGGYGSEAGCEADGFSLNVTGEIVAATPPPANAVPVVPFWLLAVMGGGLALTGMRKLRNG